MLSYRDFEPFTTLSIGEQRNANHISCPAGMDRKQRLYVKRVDSSKLIGHCHHCGSSGVYRINAGLVPLDKAWNDVVKITPPQSDDIMLPVDVEFDTTKWPQWASGWLITFGIFKSEIENYGICYDPTDNRLVFPVYDNVGHLMFYQSRGAPGRIPKWITKFGASKPIRVFSKSEHDNMVQAQTKMIVITEDIISAIKLARMQDSLPLFGTKANINSLIPILSRYQKVVIWLDPDTAGQHASIKLHKDLKVLLPQNVDITNITLSVSLQPKDMVQHSIEGIFCGL